jgi:hypothetical protein
MIRRLQSEVPEEFQADARGLTSPAVSDLLALAHATNAGGMLKVAISMMSVISPQPRETPCLAVRFLLGVTNRLLSW